LPHYWFDALRPQVSEHEDIGFSFSSQDLPIPSVAAELRQARFAGNCFGRLIEYFQTDRVAENILIACDRSE
jgi:hypothetical protein